MAKQSTSEQNKEKDAIISPVLSKKTCGIIMPIADHPNYPVGHWKEVLQIIKDSLSETEFEIQLVSDSIEIGLIHERIVTNIYTNDIIICDVSSKNPNVMFELGMRLAFDKPTIIIKDETTGYSFDTSVIEHLPYQSSLRHSAIELFKQDLKRKVIGTYEKSNESEEYSPFLKSFGRTISPGKIKSTEIPLSEYVIDKIDKLSSKVSRIEEFVSTNRNQLSRDLSNLKYSIGTENKLFSTTEFTKLIYKNFPKGIPDNFENNPIFLEVVKDLFSSLGLKLKDTRSVINILEEIKSSNYYNTFTFKGTTAA